MPRNYFTTGFSIVGLLAVACTATQQEAEPQRLDTKSQQESRKDTSLYMQAKLSNAQKVLSGLVSEDYDMISDGAKQMKRIAKAAHWPKTIDEVYQHYSFEFRRQCDKLVEHAQAKDLRAAHFTYLSMSTTCIDCHDYVRPRFKIERKPQGPVRLIPTKWDGRARRLSRPAPDDGKDTNPIP